MKTFLLPRTVSRVAEEVEERAVNLLLHGLRGFAEIYHNFPKFLSLKKITTTDLLFKINSKKRQFFLFLDSGRDDMQSRMILRNSYFCRAVLRVWRCNDCFT